MARAPCRAPAATGHPLARGAEKLCWCRSARRGDALQVSGERTKAAAVTQALREFIARRRQKGVLELAGKLEWDPGYDYKKDRSRT